MSVRLTEEEMRYMSLFERMTEAVLRDCVERDETVVFVVESGEMGKAIGKGGANIDRVRRSVGKNVEVVEYSEDEADFVANAFQPAAIESVEIDDEDEGGKVAYVEVNESDKGLAIGKEGENIETAKKLARRHYEFDDIVLN
jgi:NusA family KH domain protein, archaeal